MKIMREDKVYVQKEDIARLNMSDAPIPAIIYYKVLENGAFIVGDFNRHEYEEFTQHEAIEFFRKATWILDYDEVKDLSFHELDLLGEEIVDERNAIAALYNGLSNEEKERNQSMVTQCELLEFKAMALREYQTMKRNNKVKLPKEVAQTETPKKGIKQFIKTIFKK